MSSVFLGTENVRKSTLSFSQENKQGRAIEEQRAGVERQTGIMQN